MGSELLGRSPCQKNYKAIFEERFPYYLTIGMSADEYWSGDCTLAKAYRKADEIRRNERNHELWLQGLYIYEALCDVSPLLRAFAKNGTKPLPYPSEPYPITAKEAKERKAEEYKARIKRFKERISAWAEKTNMEQEVKEDERYRC